MQTLFFSCGENTCCSDVKPSGSLSARYAQPMKARLIPTEKISLLLGSLALATSEICFNTGTSSGPIGTSHPSCFIARNTASPAATTSYFTDCQVALIFGITPAEPPVCSSHATE